MAELKTKGWVSQRLKKEMSKKDWNPENIKALLKLIKKPAGYAMVDVDDFLVKTAIFIAARVWRTTVNGIVSGSRVPVNSRARHCIYYYFKDYKYKRGEIAKMIGNKDPSTSSKAIRKMTIESLCFDFEMKRNYERFENAMNNE